MSKGNKNHAKGFTGWMVLGVLLLVAGVLAMMFWLNPSEENPWEESSPASGTSQNPTLPDDTDPVAPTDEILTTDQGVIPADPTETLPTDISPDVPETKPTEPDYDKPTQPATTPSDQQLICEDYGLFSGAYVEDGTDEPVENVAALLVTNCSDQYLDLAKLTYELNGQEAVFMVTGLPAGSSAWVFESSRMTATADTQFLHKSTLTSFRDAAINTLDGVNFEYNGTMLKATNSTNKTYRELTVYYKVLHDDGNYLGGITYMTTFGDLEPGQSAEKIAGHFQPGKTQIVRIGYLDGENF